MSLLRVAAPLKAPLASLFFFSVFSVAQVSVPDCTDMSWQWTYNFLGQSPCIVVGYMIATCNAGQFTLDPLPAGTEGSYVVLDADSANMCFCNTVSYSLLSACGACQDASWTDWLDFGYNCSTLLPPSTFPNPVPLGISVPYWAILDVTLAIDDNWNYTESLDAGDSPEFGPGSFIGPSSELPDVTPTSSSSTDSSGGSSSHAGGIAGGVIGGVVGLIITPAAIILYLRRRLRARAAVPADVSEVSPSFPVTTRLYNPGDPNTFPEYQGILHSLDIPPQITMSSNIGTGNAVTQPSLPQAGLARGYHGLPTV